MSFRVKNITGHKLSTYIGMLILFLLIGLVISGHAKFEEVYPLLFIVTGFLLYGKKGRSKNTTT